MHNLGDNARRPKVSGSAFGSPQSRGQSPEAHILGISIRVPTMLGSLPPEAHNLGVSHNLGDKALSTILGSAQSWGQHNREH